MMMRSAPGTALAAVMVLTVLGCPSPAQDDRIDDLGGECNGVPESEFHRAGQPCVLCHDDYEGASPRLSIGGTVFATPTEAVPVAGARVTLTDSAGSSFTAETNCIGNFLVSSSDWEPAFPLHAEIECPNPDTGGTTRLVMGTRIARDGSCASCHKGPPGYDSPGYVYCAETMPSVSYATLVDPSCQGICR
jgi:hypothetical protein